MSSGEKEAVEGADRFETSRADFPPGLVLSGLPDDRPPIWQGWATRIVVDAASEGAISLGRAREILTWR
ncbi:MAG: hypothetical protein FJ125_17895 [Deltaproteobacteria bacterium]|nr:hypothetical protein [Deltaproteobacteria bacterium]